MRTENPRGGDLPHAEAAPTQHRRNLATTLLGFVVALGLLAATVWGALSFVQHIVTPIVRQPACEVRQASGATLEYDPEQVQHAATISVLARKYRQFERASTIGIATAIQESKLRNLSYGDRDSLGLFQQRPSMGWGSKAEIADPVYSANTFYTALMEVPRWSTMPLTEAAQAVQKSGFPNAYAQHETEAAAMTAAFTGVRRQAVACRLQTPTTARGPAKTAADLKRETGFVATVDGHTLQVTADNDALAWALAHWAVAQSAKHSVMAVTVGSQQWHRSMDDPAMKWSTAEHAVPHNTVRIQLWNANQERR